MPTPSHIQPQRVAPPRPAQERGDDPDDQRRLEPLPEADDEGRKHYSAAGRVSIPVM